MYTYTYICIHISTVRTHIYTHMHTHLQTRVTGEKLPHPSHPIVIPTSISTSTSTSRSRLIKDKNGLGDDKFNAYTNSFPNPPPQNKQIKQCTNRCLNCFCFKFKHQYKHRHQQVTHDLDVNALPVLALSGLLSASTTHLMARYHAHSAPCVSCERAGDVRTKTQDGKIRRAFGPR